jgi:hypothetical protein
VKLLGLDWTRERLGQDCFVEVCVLLLWVREWLTPLAARPGLRIASCVGKCSDYPAVVGLGDAGLAVFAILSGWGDAGQGDILQLQRPLTEWDFSVAWCCSS